MPHVPITTLAGIASLTDRKYSSFACIYYAVFYLFGKYLHFQNSKNVFILKVFTVKSV